MMQKWEKTLAVEAEYKGEEMQVTFTAETVRTDYGVPGSPEWNEVDPYSIEVKYLTILGLNVKMADLPDDLHDAIMALSDGLEWEE
jgi:hypothetical protein